MFGRNANSLGPQIYEVNGRQYLVVQATSPINSGGGHGARLPPVQTNPGFYVAFALPEKKQSYLAYFE